MALQVINNGETGLAVRNKLNSMFAELYGGSGGIAIGAPIVGGADTRLLYQDGAVVGQDPGLTYNKTTDTLQIISNIAVDTANVAAEGTYSVGGTQAFHFYGGSGWGVQPFDITAPGGLKLMPAGNQNALRVLAVNYSLTGASAAPMFDLAGAWDTSGTPTAIKLNITNTASNAASLLMDLLVGGVSKAKIDIAGVQTLAGAMIAGGDVTMGGAAGAASGSLRVGDNTLLSGYGSSFGVQPVNIHANGGLAIVGSAKTLSLSTDVVLTRDAANTLALRNGPGAAQTFNLYETWIGASDYSRLLITFETDRYMIGSAAAGTGTLRQVQLHGGAINGSIILNSAGVSMGKQGTANYWRFDTAAGFLLPLLDNTYDIGGAGNQVRNVIVGSSVSVGTAVLINSLSARVAAAGYYGFQNRTYMSSPADGVMLIENNAATGFGSLLLGPSGTTYNRLKHGGAGLLQCKLANDGDFSSFQAKHRTHANAVAETPPATHTIAIEDAAGTAYKVLALAA